MAGPSAPRAAGGLPPPAATLATAAAAGAGVMAVELSAVRLLAPWFGSSAAVWTNVIGVILLALSVGYLLGARAAAGEHPGRALCAHLGLGGGLVLLLPLAAGPVARLFLPAGLSLEEAAGLSTWGSLAASGLLFLLPAALLGAVGPLAVELVQRASHVHAGTAGGRVLCVSTLGSLGGTFGATHLLLPGVGVRGTFLLSGLLLVLAASLLALAGARSRRSAAALLAAWAMLPVGLAVHPSPRATGPGERLLAEVDSRYQRLRAIELSDDGSAGAAGVLRLLQVNEGLDSYQSVWRPEPGPLGPGYYYDYLTLPLAWPGPARSRVLVLGLGAGTVFRVLEGLSLPSGPEQWTGVELDPAVVELGRAHFDLRGSAGAGPGPRIAVADARVAARAARGPFDLIVLDCYANQSEIPAHLATLEFFRELRARLSPEGVLALNVGGFGADDPVVASVGETLAQAFDGRALGVRVPRARNWVLYGFEGEVRDPRTLEAGRAPELAPLAPPLELPGAVVSFEARGEPLSDDRAPLAALQARSLAEARRRHASDG